MESFSQPMIDSVIKGDVIPDNWKKELDNAVVDIIILDQQAIRVVEGEGFINLMKKDVPYYKVPSRYKVKEEMNARLDKRRLLVKNLLDSVGRWNRIWVWLRTYSCTMEKNTRWS